MNKITTKFMAAAVGYILLGLIFYKTIRQLNHPILEQEGIDLISFIVMLVIFIANAVAVKQKHWRLGCLMILISSYFIYISKSMNHNISNLLCVINLILVLIGVVLFGYFYRSDYEFQKNKI